MPRSALPSLTRLATFAVATAVDDLVAHALEKPHEPYLRRHTAMVAADGNPHEKLPDKISP
jgi:hypothetical protein